MDIHNLKNNNSMAQRIKSIKEMQSTALDISNPSLIQNPKELLQIEVL